MVAGCKLEQALHASLAEPVKLAVQPRGLQAVLLELLVAATGGLTLAADPAAFAAAPPTVPAAEVVQVAASTLQGQVSLP